MMTIMSTDSGTMDLGQVKAALAAREEPATIAIQPYPYLTQINYLDNGRTVVTAITRDDVVYARASVTRHTLVFVPFVTVPTARPCTQRHSAKK